MKLFNTLYSTMMIRKCISAILLCSLATMTNGQLRIYHDKTTASDSVPGNGNTGNTEQDSVQIGRLHVIHTEDGNGHTNVKIYTRRSQPRVKTHWFAFDFGWNNYNDRSAYGGLANINPDVKAYDHSAEGLNTFAPRGNPSSLTASEFALVPGKSVNVDIWIVRQERDIAGDVFGIEYGLGLVMNNFRYKRDITYLDNDHTTVIRDSVSFKKNKLFTEYLTVPLMLCLNFPGKHEFHIKAGVNGGYLMKSRTKQVSSARGKMKNNNDFNLSKFRVSPEVDLGWRWWSLYANYSLTPVHQYGPEQYAYAIGIRFGGF